MGSQETLLFFFAESIFFIVVLSACLKFAANKHRTHLKTILSQVNKNEALKAEEGNQKESNQQLRERLMGRIKKLQIKLMELKDIEKNYDRLKEKYDKLKQQSQSEVNSQKDVDKKNKKYAIEAGTTVDRESGVDQNYLDYLTKKKCLNDAAGSSERASGENKSYNKKIQQQRDTINGLKESIKKLELEAQIDSMKNEGNEHAIESLKQLEASLIESQQTSERLDAELSKVKKDLQASQKQVEVLEQRGADEADNEAGQNDYTNKSYTVISRAFSDVKDDGGDNPFNTQALANYEALKKEVDRLRESTSTQRQLIFTLEGQIVELKKDLQHKDLEGEEKLEKELEIKKLERLLLETEGCVDVLESEVSFLQDRINTMSKPESEVKSGQPQSIDEASFNYEIAKLSTKLEKARMIISRTGVIREKIIKIVELGQRNFESSLFEALSTRILDAVEPLSVDVHVRIITRFGQVDVANCGGIRKDQLELLGMGLNSTNDIMLTGQEGFVVAYNKVGLFARGDPNKNTNVGRLEDSLRFTLLVSEAIATTIEERQSDHVRQVALKRLVEGVKKNLNKRSIQNKYQAEELQRTVDIFVGELNDSLHTLNITENQSRFFNEMIEEVRARMDVLFATEVVVDSSFADLISKLEKGQIYLNQ